MGAHVRSHVFSRCRLFAPDVVNSARRLANSIDPGQILRFVDSDLGLRCLLRVTVHTFSVNEIIVFFFRDPAIIG